MDPAILNQLGQGQLGGLPANVVEGADDDHAGRVVDDDVDAGGFFEGADVAAFPADDAALDVVAGNVDAADGGVGGVLGGEALDGAGQDLAGRFLGDGLEVFLVLVNAHGHLVGQFLVEAFEQQPFGLFAGQAADFVQLVRSARRAGPRRP